MLWVCRILLRFHAVILAQLDKNGVCVTTNQAFRKFRRSVRSSAFSPYLPWTCKNVTSELLLRYEHEKNLQTTMITTIYILLYPVPGNPFINNLFLKSLKPTFRQCPQEGSCMLARSGSGDNDRNGRWHLMIGNAPTWGSSLQVPQTSQQ